MTYEPTMRSDLPKFSDSILKGADDVSSFVYYERQSFELELVARIEAVSFDTDSSIRDLIKIFEENCSMHVSYVMPNADDIDPHDEKLVSGYSHFSGVMEIAKCLVYFRVGVKKQLISLSKKESSLKCYSNFFCNVAGNTYDDCEAAIAELAKLIPVTNHKKEEEKQEVDIYFMASVHGEVSAETRSFPLFDTDQIITNYPEEIGTAISTIEDSTSLVDASGKLILMHGDPGTGKTSLLKMLTTAWRQWASFHYVLDPETFFGNPHYMRKCLFWKEHRYRDPKDLYRAQKKILIIEDADEFLREDAKQTQGQSMARFLNLTDGFMGHGVDFLMVITTNEKIGNINKAILRPGRCLADLHFRAFNRQEAAAWLDRYDKASMLDAETKSEFTLAELYSLMFNSKVESVEKPDYVSGTYL